MQSLSLVVIGPFGAGKTTFISSVSEIKASQSAEAQRQPPGSHSSSESASDFGRITLDDDLLINLFSAPGHRRFSFMWEIIVEGALGFVLLVDSTRPETFREARNIMRMFVDYTPAPLVIAANKQDKPGAIGPDDLRHLLKVSRLFPVLPCIATDPDSANQVIKELLYAVLDETGPDDSAVPAAVLSRAANDAPIAISRATLPDSERIAAFYTRPYSE